MHIVYQSRCQLSMWADMGMKSTNRPSCPITAGDSTHTTTNPCTTCCTCKAMQCSVVVHERTYEWCMHYSSVYVCMYVCGMYVVLHQDLTICMWCRYMYKGYADSCAARGQYWIRKTLLDLYKPTADMFPGSPSIFTFRSPHILLICTVCMYACM